jgi:uncharacterized membrane protein (UPF0127 family)
MKMYFLFILTLSLLSSCSAKTIAQTEHLVISDKKGASHAFQVEIAKNDADRAYGLMGRASRPANQGMLFVFDKVQDSAFWMKNTLIPLDIIFINENGSIRTIYPMAKPFSHTIIKSDGPVRAGLEINGGIAKKLGLRPGDIVHHRVFGNELARP